MKLSRSFYPTYLLFLISCASSVDEKVAESPRMEYTPEDNFVDILVLEKSTFPRQLVSNGKLSAFRKSDLRFGAAGQLKKLLVANGSPIKKGEVIAILDQSEYLHKRQQAQTSFKKAEMELQDVLIGQGYDLSDTSSIPKTVFNAAAIRSGYATARSSLADAEYQLGHTVLKAPFDGIVANISQKQYEQVNTSEAFCTVIDVSGFEVAFQLTETEIGQVAKGDSVKVFPLSQTEVYGGVVTEINPVVDEFGLVKVKAVIDYSRGLLEGMNVKVIVEKQVHDQLVVPKSAVVLRQNQEVLFKVVNGQAYWTYVQTDLENSTSFTVRANEDKGASLNVGDTVITSGNLNLAHESSVTLKLNQNQKRNE